MRLLQAWDELERHAIWWLPSLAFLFFILWLCLAVLPYGMPSAVWFDVCLRRGRNLLKPCWRTVKHAMRRTVTIILFSSCGMAAVSAGVISRTAEDGRIQLGGMFRVMTLGASWTFSLVCMRGTRDHDARVARVHAAAQLATTVKTLAFAFSARDFTPSFDWFRSLWYACACLYCLPLLLPSRFDLTFW